MSKGEPACVLQCPWGMNRHHLWHQLSEEVTPCSKEPGAGAGAPEAPQVGGVYCVCRRWVRPPKSQRKHSEEAKEGRVLPVVAVPCSRAATRTTLHMGRSPLEIGPCPLASQVESGYGLVRKTKGTNIRSKGVPPEALQELGEMAGKLY
ncbi:hypothetical protein NDU88_003629 [Pleurodeles waltl]|uniref:Uncharacterized protein n=1 Tax=Pleurodeles waltl TaxID=8319 RepID=A0AAV7QCM7_PLEWA|nr:hypothetical protein NDU88_003629 [Pleurodeles waltl]